MGDIQFEKALYMKLGEKGRWVESSFRENKIRFRWSRIGIKDIQDEKWDYIKDQIKNRAKGNGGTNDFKALYNICTAGSETLFITFHAMRLYWCRPDAGNTAEEDEVSKYRLVEGAWSSTDKNGDELHLSRISGKISKLQRFAGTCCNVSETEYLGRLLNGKQSSEFIQIEKAQKGLIRRVENGIKHLHPSEFELLADLIFRQSGWHRVSILGKSMKYIDMEFAEPITKDRYIVQVKSSSDQNEFDAYAEEFKKHHKKTYRKLYYIVHSIQGTGIWKYRLVY